jgi:hypothetical protein
LLHFFFFFFWLFLPREAAVTATVYVG